MPSNESFIRPDEFWRQLGLRAGQRVVHLGSGAGFYILPAAHIVGKDGQAHAIDILPDMLAEAENKAKRESVDTIVKTHRANLEGEAGSGLETSSMDWVLAANILHQSDPLSIFKEAVRIVAANGKVVVVEWDVGASPFGPPANQRRPKQEVIDIAGQAGLQLEKEFQPSPYHYGLVFIKPH